MFTLEENNDLILITNGCTQSLGDYEHFWQLYEGSRLRGQTLVITKQIREIQRNGFTF